MDTRVPHFDGQKDFLAFLRFLDNRKEFEAYIKQLDTKIAAFVKAVKLYGKAKEIDRLHGEAELLAVRARSAFVEREDKLVAGEAAFKSTMAEQTKALTEKESVMQQRLNVKDGAIVARQVDLQDREKAIGEREVAAQEKYEAAEKAIQEAREVQQAADATTARMKAAFA